MRIHLGGKAWQLEPRAKLPADRDGDCDPPSKPGKSIRIRAGLRGVHRLEVEIHELLHAADWSKDEAWVEATAHDLARILWRLGYRLHKDGS